MGFYLPSCFLILWLRHCPNSAFLKLFFQQGWKMLKQC